MQRAVLPAGTPDSRRNLLTDPQTSGGLLVACDKTTAPKVLEIFKRQDFAQAAVIGELGRGEARVTVV